MNMRIITTEAAHFKISTVQAQRFAKTVFQGLSRYLCDNQGEFYESDSIEREDAKVPSEYCDEARGETDRRLKNERGGDENGSGY
jgi:hypothetical protein